MVQLASVKRLQPARGFPERRRVKIKALKRQISRYQDVLADAMSNDFGFRAPTEPKMLDLLGSMLEANRAIAHLKRWMKPSRRATELLFLSNSLSATYQPKGVVGVIVPWNFRIYAALAAGNRVMIKMSEITPATNAVLTRLLGEIFQEMRSRSWEKNWRTPACLLRCPSIT
jgi:coniferyl-aldehyde dehydrogenase